jgi:hypothetical protein
MQSVPITTDGVSSNLDQGEVWVEVAQEVNKATCLFLSVPFYKYYGPESNTNLLIVCFTNMHNIWQK